MQHKNRPKMQIPNCMQKLQNYIQTSLYINKRD